MRSRIPHTSGFGWLRSRLRPPSLARIVSRKIVKGPPLLRPISVHWLPMNCPQVLFSDGEPWCNYINGLRCHFRTNRISSDEELTGQEKRCEAQCKGPASTEYSYGVRSMILDSGVDLFDFATPLLSTPFPLCK
ncbi:hypothetical protein VN97_g4008 [Penicillium thymicola]|uniref:Uncharacterized protein n=1 Tax=Penicillium thymicola TaxID=293382 RepID=A0AAI9X9X7_PENTH|nr:hypothetical protein VN97_g4008 [Penicillium thymicola]